MAPDSDSDWRSQLSAMEREKIAQHSALTASAFTLENEAYLSASSRQDYDAACDLLARPPASDVNITDTAFVDIHADGFGSGPNSSGYNYGPGFGFSAGDDDGSPGLQQIGAYRNCCYIGSGVAADVFRSGDDDKHKNRALKVIREAKDMQPHDHIREAKILARLRHQNDYIIPLLETFRDQKQRFVLVFPYQPFNLAGVLADGPTYSPLALLPLFLQIFDALAYLHSHGIIHRDIKPSAILLASPPDQGGPAYLSDFGTAWHPDFSPALDEPPQAKALDIGSGPYRAPETLFGHRAYGPPVDMWAAGAMLAECARCCPQPPTHAPLFHSRPAHEDGSQLGLILSIFQTLGSPTPSTWPEAVHFKTPPFEIYRVFPPKPWGEILPEVDAPVRALVARLVQYESGSRATASEALVELRKLLDAVKETERKESEKNTNFLDQKPPQNTST